MNRIRIRIRRLVGVAAGLACAWLGLAVAAPAAFAMRYPIPVGPAGTTAPPEPSVWKGQFSTAVTRGWHPPAGELSRFEPVAHHFNGVTGGMTGWQIALIAVGSAILGAVLAVLADRARAARRHQPATAT